MKVIASDFDNTLFFEHNYFKGKDLEAIQSFQKQGHLFGICSGRPFSGLLKPLEGVLQPDFFIVSTGGAILDRNHQLLYGKKVVYTAIEEIYEEYKNEADLIVQTLDSNHFYCSNLGEEHEPYFIEVNSISDMKNEDIYSISLVHSTIERAKEITQEINKKYSEVRAYQNVDSIDIVHCECSKGQAILKLKELLNIKSIAGIGDSFNDVPMLDVVDHSFTFDESPKEIQLQVDDIVHSISEAIQILENEK